MHMNVKSYILHMTSIMPQNKWLNKDWVLLLLMLCKKLAYDVQMEDYGTDDKMMQQWITEVIEM